MIVIREVLPCADPKAKETLIQLHKACFRAGELHPSQFDYGYWWIASDQDTPVAFAGITQSIRFCDVGYLCRAGVLEAARGQGLQRRLIHARLAKARRVGWWYAITDTRRNPSSANNLIACGFRMYQPAYPWSFRDACYWRKDL